jgi:hypothetical protein
MPWPPRCGDPHRTIDPYTVLENEKWYHENVVTFFIAVWLRKFFNNLFIKSKKFRKYFELFPIFILFMLYRIEYITIPKFFLLF